ncbi:piggyBac transposable element-derived protein 4-like [Ptychodera flava]|uniref:piggyBac transposable element-derived protein 4-like n=1 Tax=Ptychodera flava TaxID=63121 RepID=UPI00396A319D
MTAVSQEITTLDVGDTPPGTAATPDISERGRRTDQVSAADILREFFSDSDSDTEFEGFTAEEINEAVLQHELNVQGRDDESDIDPAELVQLLIADADVTDESETTDAADLLWTSDTEETTVPAFDDEFSGPTHNLDFSKQPIDFFELFLTEDFVELLVRETNAYAEFKQEQAGRRDSEWYATDATELRAYFGMMILMGMHKVPEVKHYWSSDDRLNVPGISKVMPRNRFMKISQYLHLSDSRNEPDARDPQRDRLYKVRAMVDLVRKTFPEHYYPHREIAIDEAMCKFKGRSHMIQYMPGKPVKWGFKIWSAACPKTGYTLDMFPYTGKKESPERGLGYQVVYNLTERYFNMAHHIYYDNFFSSVQLALDLLDRDVYVTSTIRQNRKGLPQ